LIVNDLSPTVIEPDLAGPVLASIENDTDPFPLPLASAVMDIHVSLFTAVHAQPDVAVTLKPPVPAPAVKLALLGDSEIAQAPAWLIVNG